LDVEKIDVCHIIYTIHNNYLKYYVIFYGPC
jgi:hypothetical protein